MGLFEQLFGRTPEPKRFQGFATKQLERSVWSQGLPVKEGPEVHLWIGSMAGDPDNGFTPCNPWSVR